jgi:hypothetical protein
MTASVASTYTWAAGSSASSNRSRVASLVL